MESYIKHASKNNKLFFQSILIGMSQEELDQMTNGKDFWFNAKEMCQRGIATHVVVRGLEIPAKHYLKLLKKVKKEAKKLYPKEKLCPKTLDEAIIYGIDAVTPFAEEKKAKFEKTQEQLNALLSNYASMG